MCIRDSSSRACDWTSPPGPGIIPTYSAEGERLTVAYNFHPVNRDQKFLLPLDMADWLPRDHFTYFLIELVRQLDFTEFLKAYRTDGKGGAAYDPTMMVALLFYAYCDGAVSYTHLTLPTKRIV